VDCAGVELVQMDGQLVIRVSDRGAGFDVRELESASGSGLSAARERLQLFGGRLDVDSSPGAGTRIEIGVPLDPEDRRAAR
jgi:signal transduction histidine kinase